MNHLALIQEGKQNLDASAYNLLKNQYIKIPSKKKEIDRHVSMT